ncbi:PREDICTED: putative methyltransferase DDB_G0268948 [Cyprinodon variegatus]|uniref:Si:ch211-93g23.2 n=1 Tax=Cyprinodon variegatus TaxID=28743 RepID=A0A3Q2GIB9_CYPVA|nr:PREDICTED: putative methyltransferase DDB_G0268948 [Cyprinodon variegatus]
MAVRLFEGKDHASSYLQYRVAPHEMVSVIMSYIEKRKPKRSELAVDVGCGPGQVTVLLAPYFNKVVGTDVSQAMIDRALAKSNPPNTSYRQSPAEELPFTAGEVDLVTAMTAAHWFDRPRFLQEADRVLRPGGCLALLSYTMDMNLEYGDVSDALNDICQEFYAALLPYRSSYLGPSSKKLYFDMFNSCSYLDKEWNESCQVRRTLSVSGFIGMVETFSNYQQLKQKDPSEAERLSNSILNKLLSAMNASSPDTEVTVIVNYFYMLACKPSSD